MNDKDDFPDEALALGLAEANRYDPEKLAAHIPADSGELMLRVITSPKRGISPVDRLLRTFSVGNPVFGRAVFVGVVAVVAVAGFGLYAGLSRTNTSDLVEPAEGVSSVPSDAADGADPLVVDQSPTSVPPEPEEATTATANDDSANDDTVNDETANDETVGTDDAGAPPVSVDGSGCVSIEVEDFALTGGWRLGYDSRVSGGAFVTWEGLEPEGSNTSPADVIEIQFTIQTAGAYRFVWSMRQPVEVGDTSANTSWVDVPNAARFGPAGGGSYGGFIPVSGRAKGEFDWSATAEVDGNQSEVGVEFNRPGSYTLQLAGHSHGHEIDRIVLFHEDLSRDEAITGSCEGA